MSGGSVVNGVKWPAFLENGEKIAAYIAEVSSDYVDAKFVVEYYTGAGAVLRFVPISQLQEGPADSNLSSAEKARKYEALPLETMPPLVCEGGVVDDGNHRLRCARAKGATHLWCYDVLDEEAVQELMLSSIKPALNDVTYIEEVERSRMYNELRELAIATPEYAALEAAEAVAIVAAQKHDSLIKAEALRLFDEILKKPGSEEFFFEGLDAEKREALRQTMARELRMKQARENLGPDKWPAVMAARDALRTFVTDYFDAYMPPENPHADCVRQQRDQQHGPAFKRWFEGSKVVSADGKPLVALHATAAEFDQFVTGDDECLRVGRMPAAGRRFNSNYSGPMGSWFATPPVEDNNYEVGNVECTVEGFVASLVEDTGYKPGSQVLPVYLNIRNPMEFEGFEDFQDQRDEYPNLYEFKQAMLRDGHDGFVIRSCYTDGDCVRDDWVAFDPHQIKSALGNSGAFDPASSSLVDSHGRYLVLTIFDTSTAAFTDIGRDAELARVVREALAGDTAPVGAVALTDLNGNVVGTMARSDFVSAAAPSNGGVQIVLDVDAISPEVTELLVAQVEGGQLDAPLCDAHGVWFGVVRPLAALAPEAMLAATLSRSDVEQVCEV
ncbi:MAG TPA: hypothetical protein VKJ77_01895 [Caballeronia sp.]|nr:hypothetical protein [Caballeronia sp.]